MCGMEHLKGVDRLGLAGMTLQLADEGKEWKDLEPLRTGK